MPSRLDWAPSLYDVFRRRPTRAMVRHTHSTTRLTCLPCLYFVEGHDKIKKKLKQ